MYCSTIAIACMQNHDIRALPLSRSIAPRGAAQPCFSKNAASNDSPFNELCNVICFVSVQSGDIFDLLEDLIGVAYCYDIQCLFRKFGPGPYDTYWWELNVLYSMGIACVLEAA